MNAAAIDLYLEKLKNGTYGDSYLSDADHADFLEALKLHDEERFFSSIDLLPLAQKAEILMELPIPFQVDYIKQTQSVSLAELIEALESDDATNFYQTILKHEKQKSIELFGYLSEQRGKVITDLMRYSDEEAGSLMQTEIFQASSDQSIKEAIGELVRLKQEGIGTVQSLFVTDERGKFIKSVAIDEVLIADKEQLLEDFVMQFPVSYSVLAHDPIEKVIESITKYNLTSLAVLDRKGHLLGRITHDDAMDTMQKMATQQIYNLGRLHQDEELQEGFVKSGKTRSIWLGINLINAIVASLVIGVFEETLSAIVALAILMPIVANMAGTASVQTMTVVIRQMALGNINFEILRPLFFKEINIAVVNGVMFGTISILMAQVWFGNVYVSIAIGLSMFVSFVSAGLLGTTVPILLKKLNLDPAVASSVIVITAVDIIGFFSFLWFAKMIAL